jgi:hypothetical protein
MGMGPHRCKTLKTCNNLSTEDQVIKRTHGQLAVATFRPVLVYLPTGQYQGQELAAFRTHHRAGQVNVNAYGEVKAGRINPLILNINTGWR